MTIASADILQFWFHEISPKSWWAADPEFDQLIRSRFLATWEQARRAELVSWRSTAKGRLAEVIVLDQFSRNMFRGTPAAFAQDTIALVLAQEAISAGAAQTLTPTERSFSYLPFMHSESPLVHQTAEALYRDLGQDSNLQFELRHKAIVDRFGRYPHRNAVLGRESSAEEIEFLKQPGSSF